MVASVFRQEFVHPASLPALRDEDPQHLSPDMSGIVSEDVAECRAGWDGIMLAGVFAAESLAFLDQKRSSKDWFLLTIDDDQPVAAGVQTCTDVLWRLREGEIRWHSVVRI